MIVLNYNDHKTTIKFLEMIKNYKNIDKVVVIDNNSKDNSVNEIKKYVNERIVLLESKENKGYGAGNNMGIKYLKEFSEINYISISNPDIEFKEEEINKLIEFLDKNKDITMATGRIIENGKNAEDGSWKLPTYSKCLLQTIPLVDKVVNKSLSYSDEYYTGQYSLVDCIKGCFFIARTKVLDEINGFDEDTFLYYEENILGYKLKERNYLVAVLNNVNIIHAHGITINKAFKKIEKFKILNKSRLVYMRKCLKIEGFKMGLYNFTQVIGINLRKMLYYIQGIGK
ncbi:glycosyltransferase [Clostridium celatum]|uniref:glycosyltransferase n=1 Tax=Clostridium celatum TaxID=36834 RepID=UPI001A9B6455|nr:glycosyltransferase [Clostridium celatum]